MRKFNTEGPIIAEDHYHVPPLDRVNLGEILELIRDKRYFVLHAPRQIGKTSAPAGAARPAQQWCSRQLPVRVRKRRAGPGDAGSGGTRHARDRRRARLTGTLGSLGG